MNFTVDQVCAIMDKKSNIRNMSVIAHVDHGKSTFSDSLVSRDGTKHGIQTLRIRCTVHKHWEIDFNVWSHCVIISMFYERTDNDLAFIKQCNDGSGFLINLFDSPGHVDEMSQMVH